MDEPVLIVDNAWAPSPGARLRDGVCLAARLAHGYQGSVWTLADAAGAPLPTVLKVAHGSASVVAPIEREFNIGRRLNAVAGFVPSGAGVRTAAGRFVGVVLARVPGRTLEAVLAHDPATADAAFLVEVLRQTFSALDAAQAAFGFRHNDLRLANVMVQTDGDAPRCAIIDYGLASWARGAATGPDTVLPRGAPPPPGCVPSFPYGWVDVADLEGSGRACHRPSPLEKVHTAAWRAKGDVFHLLLDLAAALHGRAWRADEAETACRLLDLVQHVTGVRPAASFGASPRPRRLAPLRLRRAWLRARAWVRPACPSLLAGEALAAPAFTGRRSCRVRWV